MLYFILTMFAGAACENDADCKGDPAWPSIEFSDGKWQLDQRPSSWEAALPYLRSHPQAGQVLRNRKRNRVWNVVLGSAGAGLWLSGVSLAQVSIQDQGGSFEPGHHPLALASVVAVGLGAVSVGIAIPLGLSAAARKRASVRAYNATPSGAPPAI